MANQMNCPHPLTTPPTAPQSLQEPTTPTRAALTFTTQLLRNYKHRIVTVTGVDLLLWTVFRLGVVTIREIESFDVGPVEIAELVGDAAGEFVAGQVEGVQPGQVTQRRGDVSA